MPSTLFQSVDRNLRRQYMMRLIASEAQRMRPPLLSIIGPMTSRYRPSDAVLAQAAPATIRLTPPATVQRLHAQRHLASRLPREHQSTQDYGR